MNKIKKIALLILMLSIFIAFETKAEASNLEGWHMFGSNEVRFYVNGSPLIGKQKVGNTTYLFDMNGNKQTGWHSLDGKDYYFSPEHNGGMITGKRKIGHTTYLFHNDGYKVMGWHNLDGKHYYFSSNHGGGMITGKRRFGNTLYVFHNDGYKVKGWHRLNGKDYYFEPINGGLTILRNGNTRYRISDEIRCMDDVLSDIKGIIPCNVGVLPQPTYRPTRIVETGKIKGNINSSGEKIYHVPGGAFYNRTIIEPEKGERYFNTEAEARAAGFRRSSR